MTCFQYGRATILALVIACHPTPVIAGANADLPDLSLRDVAAAALDEADELEGPSFAPVEPAATTVAHRGHRHGPPVGLLPAPHASRPQFKLTKQAVIADGAPAVDQVGDRIDYVVVVSNCGSCPVTVLQVRDTLVPLGGPMPPPVRLHPGAAIRLTGRYAVRPEDLHRPSICNTVTAVTQEAGSKSVECSVPVRCGAPRPGGCDFCVDKQAQVVDGGECVDDLDDRIDYRVVVTNSGGQPLTVTRIVDTLIALTGPALPIVLPPGGCVTYAGQYHVSQDDLCESTIENLVTVSTAEAGSKIDTASVKVHKTDCAECGCKDCCTWVVEECIRKVTRQERKCYTVHEEIEETVPFCAQKCEPDPDDPGNKTQCVEILGTKTVRRWVPQLKIECKPVEDVVIEEKCVRKCLKCGVHIQSCPEPEN